jgi:hypothetical protein
VWTCSPLNESKGFYKSNKRSFTVPHCCDLQTFILKHSDGTSVGAAETQQEPKSGFASALLPPGARQEPFGRAKRVEVNALVERFVGVANKALTVFDACLYICECRVDQPA